MPTPNNKHRTYCKNCKDFTVHSWKTKDDLACDTCGTVESGYIISEVEPKLIEEQRARYKDKRAKGYSNLYNSFLNGLGIQAILEMDRNLPKIIECDAGQEEIDERAKQIKLEKIAEEQKIRTELENSYSHLGRNDKCACGSGKKYKQCHLQIFKEKGIKF